jgi:hypothetical protein
MEWLEDRTLLDGGQIAQAVVQQVVADQGTLNSLLQNATQLPLIGSSLSQYSSFSTLFQDSRRAWRQRSTIAARIPLISI